MGSEFERIKKNTISRKILRILRRGLLTTITLFFVAIVFCFFYVLNSLYPVYQEYSDFSIKAVKESTRDTFASQKTSYIYDADDNVLAKLKADKDTIYLEYDKIPKYVKEAFIAVEDKSFWKHNGIDYKGLVRIAYRYLLTRGEEVHGASTITQQLARNVFLTHEVSIERKLKEILISFELENKYCKEDLLEFYINDIYYGNNYYGIGAASLGYFNKDVSELSLGEVAFLCAIPNNPTLYDPVDNYNNTIRRRDKILSEMLEEGFINEKNYKQAKAEEITLDRQSIQDYDYATSYAIDSTVQYLMLREGFEFVYDFNTNEEYKEYNQLYNEIYSKMKYKLLTGGYKVYTTLDNDMQCVLQEQIDNTLEFSDETSEEGVYALQGAATCIDNVTGKVVAIVGGRSQDEVSSTTFNRAFQSHRQPGSTIKPIIVYTPALENGYTPETLVNDVHAEDGPSNSGNSYSGSITLRKAVEKSKNVIAWKLFEELTPKGGLSYAKNMRFTSIVPNDYYLPIALGGMTYGTSTVEMSSAYSTLVNDGEYRYTTCLSSMLDSDGRELYREPESTQVYTPLAAEQMIDILEGVMISGTAAGIKWDNNISVAAGKTGTTNNSTDGWFCGVTPQYSVSVWVGYDNPRTLKGLWGSTYPASIWKNFMVKVLEGNTYQEFNKAVIEESKNIDLLNENNDNVEVFIGENNDVNIPGNDIQITSELDNLITRMGTLDVSIYSNIQAGFAMYSEALGKLEQINDEMLKHEYAGKLTNAYNEFQGSMQ